MELYQQLLLFIFAFLIVVFLFFLYTQYNINRKELTVVNSKNKQVKISAEIVDDPIKMARGLMFRSSLGENEGMLFVFNSSAKHGFWMVNTTIALDAIYFDENKTVVDIIAMQPCASLSCPTYAPKEDAKYVLEVNQGFAKKNSIIEGSKLVYG